MKEAARLLADIEHQLLERLGADNKDLFQKYIAAREEANQLAASQNFVYGYRLGLSMTAESLIGIHRLYSGREAFEKTDCKSISDKEARCAFMR